MRSLTDKYWQTPVQEDIPDQQMLLAKKLKVAPEIISLLNHRGITETEQIERFLYPKLDYLPAPSLLKNIDQAGPLILQYIEAKHDIWIWGDYDVDGVTATALLVRFFRMSGIKVFYHIPNRFSEGYGLNKGKLQEILQKKQEKTLFITVDCGIADHEGISFLREKGCDVIVTDHHEPGTELPPATVIVNCKQKEDPFPDKNLAGVAHAFYLAAALRKFFTEQGLYNDLNEAPNMKQFLDVVAVGTVADMVPLTAINRILVRGGFEVLNASAGVGMTALMRESDILSGGICSDDIAFQLGPKLNAAGRLEDGKLAVELLLTDDSQKAISLARKLTRLNNERKEQCHHFFTQALQEIETEQVKRDGFLLHQLDCPVGIVGIIASQLVNELFVPVILVCETEGNKEASILRGSCRSTENINMYALLSACKSLLIRYGGHPMAAGLSVAKENLTAFYEAIKIFMQDKERYTYRHAQVDCFMPMDRVFEQDFIAGYRHLEPFGVNNETPVFYDDDAILQEVRRMGKTGDHLKFIRRNRFGNANCVCFGLGHLQDQIFEQPTWNLIYSLTINRFRQKNTWQAKVLDIL